MLYRLVRAVAALLARLLFRLEARGTECVPRSGPVLIVANHSSMLDPPIVGVTAPRPLHFLAKAELFSIPLFGRFLSALQARPVRRGGSDPAALRTALRILQAGNALLIFPEGSRGEEGALREGKPGAGMLVVLSGAPVVPAYVEGTGKILPRGRLVPRRGTIRVSFGPPFFLTEGTGAERKERYREATRQLMAAIARVKAAAEAGPRAAALGASAAGHAGTLWLGSTPRS